MKSYWNTEDFFFVQFSELLSIHHLFHPAVVKDRTEMFIVTLTKTGEVKIFAVHVENRRIKHMKAYMSLETL